MLGILIRRNTEPFSAFYSLYKVDAGAAPAAALLLLLDEAADPPPAG